MNIKQNEREINEKTKEIPDNPEEKGKKKLEDYNAINN